MTIKLFTRVKDENDIVREWIIYHGELFGYENIQANSCATLVQQRGSYACKSFSDLSMAKTVAKHLQDLDFKVEVVFFISNLRERLVCCVFCHYNLHCALFHSTCDA